MIIRPAMRSDVPEMLRLAHEAPTAASWSQKEYERLFDAQPPRRTALVCEEAGTARGFLIARIVDNEWEIENIVIAAEVRRRRFATKLLEAFLDQARAEAAGAIFLEVRESNKAARFLYEKSGFHEAGRRVRYYSQPVEDAVLYRRSGP
jgi:[ribosomal protein S18]-alanine N-acetyltransferase